jgi:hypothetical protein
MDAAPRARRVLSDRTFAPESRHSSRTLDALCACERTQAIDRGRHSGARAAIPEASAEPCATPDSYTAGGRDDSRDSRSRSSTPCDHWSISRPSGGLRSHPVRKRNARQKSCTQTYGGTNDPNGAGMSDERITSTSQTVLSNHLRRDHATDRSPRLISRVHRSMSAHAANASVHRAV